MAGKLTPKEALRRYWSAYCDADWHLIDDDACEDGGSLPDTWEAAKLIKLDAVNNYDLDDSFASERGIVPGGSVWRLTTAGRAALTEDKANG